MEGSNAKRFKQPVYLEPLDLKILALIKERGYTMKTLLDILHEFEIFKFVVIVKKVASQENITFKKAIKKAEDMGILDEVFSNICIFKKLSEGLDHNKE